MRTVCALTTLILNAGRVRAQQLYVSALKCALRLQKSIYMCAPACVFLSMCASLSRSLTLCFASAIDLLSLEHKNARARASTVPKYHHV